MANKKRGEDTIKLGGKERKLKVNLNDLAELQDMCDGKPLMDILVELDRLNIKVLRALLYLSLRHDDPDLTPEQVGSWDMNLVEVSTKIGQVISLSLSGPNPKK